MDVKQFTVGTLFALFLLTVAFSPISTQQSGSYDPWIDTNDDGIIDIYDLIAVGVRFGAEGTPINKTAMLLELEARVTALEEQISGLRERAYADTEQKVTNPMGQITVTFPVGMFTNASSMHISISLLILSGAEAGKPAKPSYLTLTETSATCTVETWDGVTSWLSVGAGVQVQVSYTAVQTP